MKWKLCIATFVLIAGPVTSSWSQSYPNRPVRIIVPLAPGGGMDAVTRALAQKLGDAFRETFVVDNRPGAGSQVGLDILANAAPDGYTLMMLSATTVIHPLLYGSRHNVTRDFAPVSQVTAQGYALVVHPSLPARSVGELVQYLKAHPGKINYASSGIGSPIHMTTELFQIATGTNMIHVPFKGLGAAYNDLVAGRIELSFATVISSLPHVTSGRLRALAVSTPKRVPAVPDMPTLQEAGVPISVVNWYGLIAPRATPPALLKTISSETAKAMRSADMTKRLAGDGSEPVGSTPDEFRAHLRSESEQWKKVIQQAGIRAK
jgi:tripartite-type tricarboxylate transporter receptor subunit TctC